MLSFIFRLSTLFQTEHGFAPNVVYLSPLHYARLRAEIRSSTTDKSAGYDGHAGRDGISLQTLREMIGLEVMISEDVMHPRVGWMASAARLSDTA